MKRSLKTFYEKDLPSMASHCDQEKCGFSIYRGVLVQWDEDHDERVLGLLDSLSAKVLDELLVIQEHEGCIQMIWKNKEPKSIAKLDGLEEPKGDWWFIYR